MTILRHPKRRAVLHLMSLAAAGAFAAHLAGCGSTRTTKVSSTPTPQLPTPSPTAPPPATSTPTFTSSPTNTPTPGWHGAAVTGTPVNLWSVSWQATPALGWIVGDSGTILRYDSVADAWTQYSTSPTTKHLYSVTFSGTDGWAVGQDQTVLKYVGSSWITTAILPAPTPASGTPSHFYGVAHVGSGSLYVVGSAGRVLKWDQNLGNWVELACTTPVASDLRSVVYTSATSSYACGDLDTFVNMATPAAPCAMAPVATPPASYRSVGINTAVQIAFAVGTSGSIRRFEAGNPSAGWQFVAGITNQNLFGVYIIGLNIWACGGASTVVHSADGGGSWTSQPAPPGPALTSIVMDSPAHGWAAGQSGTVLEYF